MTKRTRAATAIALPADRHPDRRRLLASAGAAAALIASTSPAALAAPPAALPVDPDAALTAVRSRWIAAKMRQAAREVARNPGAAAALAALPMLTCGSTPSEVLAVSLARTRIIGRLHDTDAAGMEDDVELEDDVEWEEAFRAELCSLDEIAATPARTLAGLGFKMDVLACEYHDGYGLQDSVAADVRAFAAAHPALAL